MRRRLTVSCLLAAALAAIVPVAAQARAHKYVNPFTNPAWLPARTDMGVDWIPTKPLPVKAIGDAVILGSNWQDSGWPGNHVIWYQLTDGSHAGDIIYVAEHLRNLLPAGTTVRAGRTIAWALPGYPWIEMGWAYSFGAPRAYPCYYEGEQTNSGKEMARFLESLGATVLDPPGRGPDWPTGRLC